MTASTTCRIQLATSVTLLLLQGSNAVDAEALGLSNDVIKTLSNKFAEDKVFDKAELEKFKADQTGPNWTIKVVADMQEKVKGLKFHVADKKTYDPLDNAKIQVIANHFVYCKDDKTTEMVFTSKLNGVQADKDNRIVQVCAKNICIFEDNDLLAKAKAAANDETKLDVTLYAKDEFNGHFVVLHGKEGKAVKKYRAEIIKGVAKFEPKFCAKTFVAEKCLVEKGGVGAWISFHTKTFGVIMLLLVTVIAAAAYLLVFKK